MKRFFFAALAALSALASISAQSEERSFAFSGTASAEAAASKENEDSVFSGLAEFDDASCSAAVDAKLTLSRGYAAMALLDFTFSDSVVLDGGSGATLEDLAIEVREFYADLGFGDAFYLRAGKQRLSWGCGYVLNPSDPVNPPKDPTRPRASLEGVPALKAEIIAEPVSLIAFAVVHERLEDIGYGGKVSTSAIPNTDISASAYWSPSQSWTAALNASVAPLYALPGWDSLLVWAEGAIYDRDRYASYDAGMPALPSAEDADGTRYAFLVGSSAKIPVIDTMIIAEYYRLDEGLSAGETSEALDSPAWYGEIARRPGRLGKDYLFASVTQASITSSGHPVLDKIGLSASCLVNLTDASAYVSASCSLGIVDNASLELSAGGAFGGIESEFGNALERCVARLALKVHF